MEKEGQVINIKRTINHKNYNISNLENNLSIVELEEPIVFNEKAKKIDLPESNEDFIGKLGTVTGWGGTSEEGIEHESLQAVELPIIGVNDCRKYYNDYDVYSLKNIVCAGYEEGGKDACVVRIFFNLT